MGVLVFYLREKLLNPIILLCFIKMAHQHLEKPPKVIEMGCIDHVNAPSRVVEPMIVF